MPFHAHDSSRAGCLPILDSVDSTRIPVIQESTRIYNAPQTIEGAFLNSTAWLCCVESQAHMESFPWQRVLQLGTQRSSRFCASSTRRLELELEQFTILVADPGNSSWGI